MNDAGGGFTPNPAQVAAAIAFAEQQLGKPYQLGGAGATTWDCSGLTMESYAVAGINIGSHYVSAQLSTMQSQGRMLPFAEKERGDLIFWTDHNGDFPHVAIYLGNNSIIAAPTEGENVKIQPLWSQADEYTYAYVGRPTGTP